MKDKVTQKSISNVEILIHSLIVLKSELYFLVVVEIEERRFQFFEYISKFSNRSIYPFKYSKTFSECKKFKSDYQRRKYIYKQGIGID